MELSKGRFLRLVFLVFFAILTSISSKAQLHDDPSVADSGTLRSKLIRNGIFHAHARSFFMATDNRNPLTDYFAWGVGAGIGYESPIWKNFQFAVTGFFIFNLASSDLSQIDSLAKAGNRYEIGLFDITNPHNKSDLDRLENLYLRYYFPKSWIQIGRMDIHTPFLNRQDGRMRGTLEEGIWFSSKLIKPLTLEGGWIWSVSPRSTVHWYSIGKSIGVYPSGINIWGNKSQYPGALKSLGIFTLGLGVETSKFLYIQLWNLLTENIFNTAFFELDGRIPLNDKWNLRPGFIYTRQDPWPCPSGCAVEKTYMPPGQSSNIFSSRIALERKSLRFSLNYTRITNHGRFLMPREWGREYFYTFMPRERSEGLGNMHAVVTRLHIPLLKGKFVPSLSYGHFYLPSVDDFRLNKYKMPSFSQLNLDLRYRFEKYLRGLTIQFLMVYKGALTETYNRPDIEFNRVRMFNWSIVVDYAF